MEKPTLLFRVTIVFFLLFYFGATAQNLKAFTPRFDEDINGNILLIGNNILSKDNTNFNDNSEYNSNVSMRYVDIDGDASTFSSSTATLSIPNPSCAKVRYAGLYWSALLQSGGRVNINKVKIKTPTAGYTDITGTIIWDASSSELGGNRPYACYADVTNLVGNGASGNYTIANVLSSIGSNGGTGLSAGWSLVVIYEDPTLPARSITTFDGFSGISSATGNLNIPVAGFRTIPSGPVRAQYAFSALEGDKPITGDFIMINGTKVTPPSRPRIGGKDNFFNSTVTDLSGVVNTRIPASTNTLGFDAGILDVPNPSTATYPGGSVIKNGDTSATMTMGTTQDTYFLYFNAFAVEIIEPNIVITKVVQDEFGNDAANANVTLGQILFYEIEYQNKGNDDAVGFTIKDILPLNTIFKPSDLDLTNAGGTTFTYDATTRTILFTIPDASVQEKDPKFKIRFKVQVVPTCNELSNACSNIIRNQAFGNYKGRYSGNVINQDPSIPSASPCLFAVPSPTNFLVGLEGCVYTRNEILCGTTTTLKAASGYSSYSWSKNADGSNPFAFTQSIIVNAVGTYYVRDTAAAPCLSITEVITISLFGGTVNNPVLPFADQTVTCANDGKKLPLIFLCGGNATKLIKTGISDGSTIVWDKLNENATCPAATNTTVCANESSSCSWSQVGMGQDYLVNTAGQYRMTLNYPGGCFNRFYFNVFQNVLNPTATVNDIVCTTNGKIAVGGVPPGYEYSLDGVTYQDSNVFIIAKGGGGIYTAFIRQKGVTTNPCVFTVPNIFVRERDFTVDTFVTPPLCNGGKGSVKLAVNDVLPQYFYKISQGGIAVNSVGPILASDYTFTNLSAGTYQVEVSTSDGCYLKLDVVIPDTPELKATVAITIPLTCNDGEVTVFPTGGTSPYFYFVNSATVFQGDPKINIKTAGLYTIDVVDVNNCTAKTSITAAQTPPPTFNVIPTDVLCVGTNTGTMTFGSIVTNGNILRYAIDVIPGTPTIPETPDTPEIPGTPPTGTFVSSPVFTGLAPGTYTVAVEYTFAGQVCYSNLQTVTINAVTAITGSAALTQPYTCLQNGEITGTASGGVGPYTYSLDGVTFQASPIFAGLTNGTYSITIKDANGCTFVTNSVIIDPLTPPTDLGFSATALSCPSKTSTITLNTTGGFGSLTYTILPALPAGVTVLGNVFSGIVAGTYTFQVTDAKNCSYQKDFSIAPLPTLTLIGQLVSNVKCFNTPTGSVKFTVSNFGAGGFTYTINGGASISGPSSGIIDLTNQPAGTYTIVVTDVTSTCTETTSVTITNAPADLTTSIAVNPIKCLGANGSVIITASGGWGGYSYTLTPPAPGLAVTKASATFSNLSAAGNYTVTTTDANGCAVSNSFALSTPIAPTAAIDPSSDLCFDGVNAAKIIVSATGGVGRILEYNINGGSFQAGSTFANLTPGNYTVIVRDDYGCSITLPAVTIAPQLTVSTVLTKDLDCSGSPEAIITGSIAGGTAPYVVTEVIGGAGGTLVMTSATTFTYTTANPRNYQFQVTDATGVVASQNCIALSGVTVINPFVKPTASIVATNVSCQGGSNGTITITPILGTGPFMYSKDNGVTFQVLNVFSGLNANAYNIVVRDIKNCPSDVIQVVITEPTAVGGTITLNNGLSCGASNQTRSALITVTGSGGTGPYQYSFDGGLNYSATNTYLKNNPGIVTAFIKDANGCVIAVPLSVTVSVLTPPTDLTFSQPISTNCTTVQATANGGVSPLTYEITFPSAAVASNGTGLFLNLAGGTYIFKVIDVNGCFYTESYTVTPIAVTGLKIADVKCFGGFTGAIRFTVSNNAGTFTPLLTSIGTGAASASTAIAGNVIDYTNLKADTYTLTVTDDVTGCSTVSTIVISQPVSGLTFSATRTHVHCNNYNSQITVTASGGSPNYLYAAVKAGDPAPASGVYSINKILTVNTNSGLDLDWDVYVKDANDCTVSTTVSVDLDPLPTVTPQTPPCFTGAAIPLTIAGTTTGVSTYSIGFGYQSSPNFSITTSGSYTLSIKDANGCVGSIPYVVNPKLTLSAVLDKDITCSPAPTPAQIMLTASGGNGTYVYEYSTDGGATYNPASAIFTTNAAGSYTFRVTSNLCTAVTAAIVVHPTATPIVTVTAVNPTCNGSTDGSIKLTASAGDAPYQYSFNGGGFSSSNVFGGLVAGTYSYIVKDNKGCDSAPASVTLNNPSLIVASITPNALICGPPQSLGSIDVSITSGGIGPFTYTLYDNTFTPITTLVGQGGVAPIPPAHTFFGLDFGDYYITIVDSKGCEFKSAKQRIITPPFIDNVIVTPGATCSDGATVTVNALITAGGVAPFIYSIIGNPLSTLGVAIIPSTPTTDLFYTFNNVPQGATYLFKVADVNGCAFILEYTIPPISGISVAVNATTNVSCNGAPTGSVDLTVSNFDLSATGLFYELLNPITNLPVIPPVNGTIAGPFVSSVSGTIFNLKAGDYVVRVREVTGTECSSSVSFNITQPTPLTATISNEVNANCNKGAQLTIAASGGTGPYQYAFVANGAAQGAAYGTDSFATLNPPTLDWDIWVKDANGCEFKIDHLIIKDTDPTITAPSLQCYSGSPLTINIGGTTFDALATATYSIGGAFQTSNSFTVNAPGIYNLFIKDGNGCTATTTYEVRPQLLLNAILTKEQDCLTASPNATITVTATGGVGPYSYEASTDGGVTYTGPGIGFVGNVYTAGTGNYTFRVTDSQVSTACQAVSNDVIVAPITNPTAMVISTDPRCNGGNNGSVQIIPAGGLGGYQYSFNGSGFTGTSLYTGLIGGTTYSYQVRDSKGCTSAVNNISLGQPASALSATSIITTSLTCGGGNAPNPATVTISATGGTLPYYYSFDGGTNYSTVNTYQSSVGITFNVFVKDGNGCLFTLVNGVDIPLLNPPTGITFVQARPITCNDLNSDVTLTMLPANNGVAPFTFDNITTGIQNTTGIFSALLPGTYLFQVTDANNCTYQESYTVLPVTPIAITGSKLSDVKCNGGNTGAIKYTVSGYAGTYTAVLTSGTGTLVQTGNTVDLTNLIASSYTVTVTDNATGCTAPITITITQPTVLNIVSVLASNVNCNKSHSQITVTAQDGTPNYTYATVIAGSGAPGPGAYGASNVLSVDTAGGTVLGWDVYVKDLDDCTVMTTVNVVLDPLPSVTVPAIAANQCNTTGALYTFTTSGASGVPPYEYSIGNGFQASPTFTVAVPAAPTTYIVTIKDANGCTAASPTPVTVYPPLGLTAGFTTPPVCTNADGVITAVGTGGSVNYSYTLLDSASAVLVPAQASGIFSTIAPGNYQVLLTDTTTLCTKTVPVNLSIPILPDFVSADIAVNNVSCTGANDANITVNLRPLTNIDPLYTYTLTPTLPAGAAVGPQNSNVFSNLGPGTYDVTVTSGSGCFTTVSHIVTEPAVLTISSITATAFTCASNKTSNITINATGGTPIYNYSIDSINYFASNIFSVIDKQDGVDYALTVYVKDANGCSVTGSVNIDSVLPLIATVNPNAAIDCNNTGSIAITASGGSGIYSYQLLPNGVAQPSNIFPITASGDYYFQVNDINTGCTFATAKYPVAPFNLINVVATPITTVTCFGATNGAVVITITGYTGTYDYQVSDSSGNPYGGLVTGNTTATPLTIPGLSGGSYTIRVTETANPFCTFTSNVFTIASPAIALSVNAVQTADVTCTNNQGAITAKGIGGWAPLEYELTEAVLGTIVGYSSKNTFYNLPEGNYTVNVKDVKNCSASSNVLLNSPVPITFSASANVPLLTCNGDSNASITATNVAGGKGSNYFYTLNTLSANPPTVSGPQATPVFDGLGSGRYSVTVDDEWNCTQTSPQIIIDEPAPVTASLALKSRQTCLTDPIVTLTASGGTAPYSYVDALGATIPFNPSVDISIARGSLPITNHYIVTDANGCTSFVSNDILIEPLEPLSINLDLTNAFVGCKGDASGMVVANAKGGLGNYIYVLLDGSGNTLPTAVQNSPGIFTNLVAGFYQVQVNSGVDCQFTTNQFEIKGPAVALTKSEVITNVLCNANNDGQIVITGQGGTGIIEYAITPNLNKFFEEGTFKNLAPGSYQYIVQDQAGCFALIPFAITEPNPIIAVVDQASIVQELCFGDNNAAFSIVVTGGTEPYSTSLDNPNGVYTTWPIGQSPIPFTGLTGGNHIVYIKDFNGCEFELAVPLNPSILLDPKAIVNYTCETNVAGNTVTVTTDASNVPADVTYSLDNSSTTQTSNVFTNLAPGDHFIMVHHKNGCVDATPVFTILQIEPLAVSLSQGQGLNEIVATTTGGSGTYQYALNGESYGTQNKFIYYQTGDYTVVVTDSYGCTATDTKFFEFIDIEIPNVFTPNGSGTNDTWKPEKTDNYPNMVFHVYDRYGREVATLAQGQSWDGKYNSTELPMGDYWYVLKLRNTKDDREFIGHFTLYR